MEGEPLRLVPKEAALRSEAQEAIIRHLETWLERAKAGELDGLAVAAIYSDGCSGTSFSPSVSYHRLLGAIADLQHIYAKAHN